MVTAARHTVQDRRSTRTKLPMTKSNLKEEPNVEADTTDAGSTASEAESGRCSSSAEVSPVQMDLLWPDKPLPPGQIQRGQDLPPKFSLLPGQVFRNQSVALDKPGKPDGVRTSSAESLEEGVSRNRRGAAEVPIKRAGCTRRQKRGPAPRAPAQEAPSRVEPSPSEERELLERAASLRLPLKVKMPENLPQTPLDLSLPAKCPFFPEVDANISVLVQATALDPLLPLKKNLTDFLLQPSFLV